MISAALSTSMALLGALNPGPQTVRYSVEVHTWRARAVAEDVSAFVKAQVQEVWSASLDAPAPDFAIRLRWPNPENVHIRVQQGPHVWVDQPVNVPDPSSARTRVWLLVRSAVERASRHTGAERHRAGPSDFTGTSSISVRASFPPAFERDSDRPSAGSQLGREPRQVPVERASMTDTEPGGARLLRDGRGGGSGRDVARVVVVPARRDACAGPLHSRTSRSALSVERPREAGSEARSCSWS